MDEKNKAAPKQDEPLLSTRLAGMVLASRLGESAHLWAHRLANWRRPGRSGPVLPREVGLSGSPGYAFSDLEAFANQRAAVASLTSTSEGDRVRCGALPSLASDSEPHVTAMFAIGSACKTAYALEAADAKKLGMELIAAAAAVERKKREAAARAGD